MKVFDEKQTAAILKKAAENSQRDFSKDTPGLTVDELEQIASDSGIDPKEVSKAIAEIELGNDRSDQTFWGGPFSFFEQVGVGHEISALEWENMLVVIREFFKSPGEISTRASVFEWNSPWGTTNSAQVTALKEQGKTKISVSWKGPMTALPFYIPLPLVAIASVFFASEFLELSAVPGLLFVLASVGLTFAAGRWALRRQMHKGFSKLRKLVANLRNTAVGAEEQSETLKDGSNSKENETSNAETLLNLDLENDSLAKQETKKSRRIRE